MWPLRWRQCKNLNVCFLFINSKGYKLISSVSGDIGGSMGLFVGASVLTMYEVFDLLLCQVIYLFPCTQKIVAFFTFPRPKQWSQYSSHVCVVIVTWRLSCSCYVIYHCSQSLVTFTGVDLWPKIYFRSYDSFFFSDCWPHFSLPVGGWYRLWSFDFRKYSTIIDPSLFQTPV